MTYDPLTGEGWDRQEAASAWSASMNRSIPRWSLQGMPGKWRWRFFNFGPWTGRVSIEDDGFHWWTHNYDTGEALHSGVTTSLYEAYQSVEQNKTVRHADREETRR